MLCLFCLKPIGKNRRKYCSILCIKRAWNLRKYNPKESIFIGNPQKGVKWEEWFIKKFGAIRPSKSFNTPYDFNWNNEKIDLKICELYKRKKKRGKLVKNTVGWWTFNRNGNGADFMICLGLLNNQIMKVYKIPNKEFPKTGATISPAKSKYNRFLFNL